VILVDTDILIWILRGRDDIREKMEKFIGDTGERLFISPVQISEVFAGLRQKERTDTSLFLNSISCIAIDARAGDLAGEYLNQYGKSHGVTLADALISACAKLHDLRLWTLNRKHYPMIARNDFID
jgi:predicted nucleic acid-binding protein